MALAGAIEETKLKELPKVSKVRE